MGDTFSLDPEPIGLSDVEGFRTGAASCGLKADAPDGAPDIGVLVCENPDGAGAAVLTKNAVRAAPVSVTSPRATTGLIRCVIANAGNANCHTGEDGLRDAREMIDLAASGLDVPQERVLVASNGAMGRALPMEGVRKGVEEACRDANETGRGDFAAAIAASDVACNIVSGSGTIEGKPFRIAGIARPASLAAPDTAAAAVFAFLVTDVAMSPECLCEVLISVSERTFDRLIVDGGAGTNDTLCALASGRAGNELVDNIFSAGDFTDALEVVARRLITGRLAAAAPIEVRVSGAESERAAETVSRAVGRSALVRTAIQNGKADWGLVLAAAGGSAARVDGSRATVRIAGEVLYDKGKPVDPLPEGLEEKLKEAGVTVELDLGLGDGSATMWAHGLPGGGSPEELLEARRKAKEAEAERASLHGKLQKEASAREAATRETQVLRKRLDSTEEARVALEAAGQAKVKEVESARAVRAQEVQRLQVELKRSAEEAKAVLKAALQAERKELEAKLKEAEAAREAASGQSKELQQRLQAAEEVAAKAVAASAAEREALGEKLGEKESAQAAAAKAAEEMRGELKKSDKTARATIVANRKEFEEKLKELESTREATSAESKGLSKRLEAAERAAEEAKSSTAGAHKELEAKLKEARSTEEAARAAAAEEAEQLRKQIEKSGEEAKSAVEATRKELEAKLKEARSAGEAARAAAVKEAEDLRKQIDRSGKEAESRAGAAVQAKEKELAAKLKEARSTGEAAREAHERESKDLSKRLVAAERAVEEAKAGVAGALEDKQKGLAAKLKEAEAAREASLKEIDELKSGLKLAEQAAEDALQAKQKAAKLAGKEAKGAVKLAEKEAKAAAKAAAKEAKAGQKELEAKLKEAAGREKQVEDLTGELTKRDELIVTLEPLAKNSEMYLAEARRYWEEAKQINAQLTLKDQLVKQFTEEEKKREDQVKELEKQVEELRSKLKAAGAD